ncbi:aldehyde dehydrogenase family protein [Ancylobacter sp.]|uniref:aldehyde dehydrogenase family protein n=1 Tax=Ancylobacter sp. TaxID=1872567 RepID=UPI003BADA0FA
MPTYTDVLPHHRDLYYGGQWLKAGSGKTDTTINPATGESLGSWAVADASDVDAAVRKAQEGFRVWRAVKPADRAVILRQAAQVIRDHAEEIALIDSADSGGPYRRMIRDSEGGAAAFDFFAGLVTEMKGSTLPVGDDTLNYTMREPLGVVVRINAYNHPFLFAASRAAAPLAAGNALIIKPPDQAPLSTLRLAELIGPLFPPGVINVLTGGRECGEALVEHPLVAKVALIGSVPTGKAIARAAAGTLKKVGLELGGKNALIAYPDSDPAKVAAGAVNGMNFTWCGQSCGSTSRIFLHDDIHDEVVEGILKAVEAYRFGLPTDEATQMGCMISAQQLSKTEHYVTLALKEGARLVAGGARPSDPVYSRGFFYPPTVFTDVTPDMTIAREEVFGPVMSILRWRDEDAMIEAVNRSELGLTASIWTRNLATAHRAAARVEAGYIWINGSSTHTLGAPFGGYKQSGLGREESLEELLECTQLKNINVSL